MTPKNQEETSIADNSKIFDDIVEKWVNESVGKLQRRVFRLIAKNINNTPSVPVMADKLGNSPARVQGIINQLCKKKLIEVTKSNGELAIEYIIINPDLKKDLAQIGAMNVYIKEAKKQ